MSFELDIHAVGEGQSSGDAITLRFGTFRTPQQKVVVVDGGYKADGERLVDFIPHNYGTRTIDLVVSTHPHDDHVSGLRPILESLEVRELWMHRPWARSRHPHLHHRWARHPSQPYGTLAAVVQAGTREVVPVFWTGR